MRGVVRIDSHHHRSQQLGLSSTTTWRILRKVLGLNQSMQGFSVVGLLRNLQKILFSKKMCLLIRPISRLMST